MTNPPIRVEPFTAADACPVLALMRSLAEFEGYINDFAVTEADLIEHGLGSRPRFGVLVARTAGADVAGIAVHYVLPWTYDMRPALVLKELFVRPDAQRQGVGHALMKGLTDHAEQIGAARINWTVLKDNHPARTFYRALGGEHDARWEPWTLPLCN